MKKRTKIGLKGYLNGFKDQMRKRLGQPRQANNLSPMKSAF
ncbi:hypothetical protein B4102_2056 [Heyndrickxia sporothermodurans]|uniref:Uncharacterized protein n=1 Tax=Heyndrickxia sporothermodurans TaxID=46224 RepID=A0A150KLH7_9BACI|nr:hypothetical protein B4102_2056 [Heyndrickxia sporothermodurans]